jgi:RHS repeat-associated protein
MGSMSFEYTFGGEKIKKTSPDGDRQYVGGMEYKDGGLQLIHVPNGRIIEKEGVKKYQYHLADHLGNIVVLFDDVNEDGTISIEEDSTSNDNEIIQRNHYYSFGMRVDAPHFMLSGKPRADYLYNGKELNEELGLNWLDYGARWYDASIGRWNAVDPLADSYTPFSPYSYVLNNPISLIDPDGMQVETIYKNKNSGETVEVNDGVDKTIEVNDPDFETAKEFAGQINGAPDSKVRGAISQETGDAYLEFYNRTNSYDGISLANIYDYLYGGPDIDRLVDPSKPLGAAGGLEFIGGPGKLLANQVLKRLLPSWKKVSIDIGHIVSGHTKNGARAQASGIKDLFPDYMDSKSIEKAVRNAYKNVSKKIKSQDGRVFLRGQTDSGMTIEMWLNKTTKTIETAWPKF